MKARRSAIGMTCLHRNLAFFVGGLLVFAMFSAIPNRARACGCVVTTDYSIPLVQAGEEILFIVENGRIEMHVKVRYAGRSGDFGWLVPLPSPPTKSDGTTGIDLGTDELFEQLEARTQPTYFLSRQSCPPNNPFESRGCHGGTDVFGSVAGDVAPPELQVSSPLVRQDAVGPYDFAILKGDDKSAMLSWLSTNGYVVPAGNDAAIAQYIRPGAHFLALRLRAGATTGDLQPIVLSYPGDLPMIPITLTSVGAQPNMGILVWVLGAARAIPRNYAHVVINEAQLDWLNQVNNYNDVVNRAIAEAPGRHGFVTEYAHTSDRMRLVFDTPGRFDFLPALTTQRDPAQFIKMLQPKLEPFVYEPRHWAPAIPLPTRARTGFAQNAQLFGLLSAHVPRPAMLAQEGVSLEKFYGDIEFYLKQDRAARPQAYADIEAKLATFDPALLVRELADRIMLPTLRIGEKFASSTLPTLTRLYTVLSPEDMNSDPVFGFNSELPGAWNSFGAWLNLPCEGNPGRLQTPSGIALEFSQKEIDENVFRPLNAPASLRIETLRETGMPEVLIDNRAAIRTALEDQGCATASRRHHGPAGHLAVSAIILSALLLRRRARSLLRLR